jgi:hypothetical protein
MVGQSNMAAIGFTYAQQMPYPVLIISDLWFQYRSDVNTIWCFEFKIQYLVSGLEFDIPDWKKRTMQKIWIV